MTESGQSILHIVSEDLEKLRRLCERELELIRGDSTLQSAGMRIAYARVITGIRKIQGK